MEKINPTAIGFFDLPREIRDMIYAQVLPSNETLSIKEQRTPFDPEDDQKIIDITGISSTQLTYSEVRSNLVLVSRLVHTELLSVFYQSNKFEFVSESILTDHLGKLRSNKVTDMIKYRVATAIGTLGGVSHWIQRLEFRVNYLSAASMFWLCEHGIPELQRIFPQLKEVTVGFRSVTNFAYLHGHALAQYVNGDIPNVTAFPDILPKEEFAATFDGIVKALWGKEARQPNPPKYPDILHVKTRAFESLTDEQGGEPEVVLIEVMLTHWKRIFEAMEGNAPNAKQPIYGNEGNWDVRVWKLLKEVIRPSWGVREEDMTGPINWGIFRPALRG
ncbi:hypothetical protein EG327_006699 [Venturia inaequalis]|uniref:Uncharacterized protein n=1 Tax=Venturia inaequalis TaxID=5025 RepID=A0A8H3V0C3_VENIN|nr:hypothetical protein EG327_006699 [Venturia inaequalis]